MSNLSEKQTEIVRGLEKGFPDREVTMKQLMEWAENEGFSKYAPSFIKFFTTLIDLKELWVQ